MKMSLSDCVPPRIASFIKQQPELWQLGSTENKTRWRLKHPPQGVVTHRHRRTRVRGRKHAARARACPLATLAVILSVGEGEVRKATIKLHFSHYGLLFWSDLLAMMWDGIEAARSNFGLPSLRVYTVYWLTYCIYFQCVFILCSSCSPQPLTYSRYLSFGLSLPPSFPRGRTPASKICYIDLIFLSAGRVIKKMKLWEILQHTMRLSPNHTELRERRWLLVLCFLVCWSVIRIDTAFAAARPVEQTWWIIELGLDKHSSWLKTDCDNIKSSTNTNQQSWSGTQGAGRKLVGSDNRALRGLTCSDWWFEMELKNKWRNCGCS